ncbi:MAG: hypothetical protein LBE62_03125 [Azonexus sp.]|jgi:hypothetical protein|nr:hypothetical protein [Azonexus sp.]
MAAKKTDTPKTLSPVTLSPDPSPASGRGGQPTGEATAENAAAPPSDEIKADRLLVRSSVEGFRRGGRAWSKAETEVSAADFTAEQLRQIMAEPRLTVQKTED